MRKKEKIVRIGFDLDGVIIDKPPFFPQKLIEWLVRSHKNKHLAYRYPKTGLERIVRWISHHPVFRPPIRKNVELLRELSKNENYELYVVSGRYGFLDSRTKQWFRANNLNGLFRDVYINTENKQPHLFKEEIVKTLKLNYFVDDDLPLIKYLKKRLNKTQVIFVEEGLEKLKQEDRKKVLFVLTYYRPHWTGLTKYAASVAEGLVAAKHDVSILCTQHGAGLPGQESIGGVRINRTPVLFRFSRTQISPLFLVKAALLIKETDVVIVFLPLVEAIFISILAKFFGKKLILVHNGDLVLPKGALNRFMEFIYYLTSFFSIKLSDKIVVHTKDYSKHSKLLSKFESKWQVIPTPVKVYKARGSEVRKFKRDNGLENKKLVGFSGRFVEEKGVEFLLKAIPLVISRIPSAYFVFAGESKVDYENYWQKIEPLIRKNKRYLKTLGLILDRKILMSFYSSLDVLAISSQTDCFPTVQVEAVLLGIPVVCTDIPGARWVVKSTGMGVLVQSRNPLSLARGIIKVLKGRESFIKPREEIEKIFDYDRTINDYDRLLQD